MTDSIRSIVLLLLQVMLSPLILACWIERETGRGEQVFSTCAQLLSLGPGLPGSLVRKAFYMGTLDRCTERAQFSIGVMFSHPEVEVGEGVSLGAWTLVGRATIGPGANIGSRVSITSGRHQHVAGSPAAPPAFSRVRIGRGAWLGEGAIVMADVGDDAVVGAGSVVVEPVPPRTVAVGNPARVVKRLDAPGHPDPGSPATPD